MATRVIYFFKELNIYVSRFILAVASSRKYKRVKQLFL